jgi:hypothetical protein
MEEETKECQPDGGSHAPVRTLSFCVLVPSAGILAFCVAAESFKFWNMEIPISGLH